jgi:hypothetical protein
MPTDARPQGVGYGSGRRWPHPLGAARSRERSPIRPGQGRTAFAQAQVPTPSTSPARDERLRLGRCHEPPGAWPVGTRIWRGRPFPASMTPWSRSGGGVVAWRRVSGCSSSRASGAGPRGPTRTPSTHALSPACTRAPPSARGKPVQRDGWTGCRGQTVMMGGSYFARTALASFSVRTSG